MALSCCIRVHVLEEFVFDWQSWARNVLHLPAQWQDFYITNALVIVLGVVAAEIAPLLPAIALSFPTLMLINATFFHLAPFALSEEIFARAHYCSAGIQLPK